MGFVLRCLMVLKKVESNLVVCVSCIWRFVFGNEKSDIYGYVRIDP